MTHTPGPWTSGGFSIIADRPYPQWREIATVTCNTRDLANPEVAANVRLIAAAPALLEALKIMRMQFGNYTDGDGAAKFHACNIADAAIAKAEGRE